MLIKVNYDQSCGIIKNGFNLSEIFKFSSGVKQGGVWLSLAMSGYLYNFNMDDYYIQSQIKNVGTKINEIFMGCVGYCDENINISSIDIELQLMILTSRLYF
jgi:hypothetical protein